MKKKGEFHTVRGYEMINAEKRLLTPSMEDYLEMIYRICKRDDYIRMNQLAKHLNVRPSSATKTVQRLSRLGMVDYQKYGIVRLTEEGEKVGRFLLKRHNIIEEFLKNIGTEDTRLKDTEMIEHNVSLSTLRNIYILNKFLSYNPSIKEELKNFKKQLYKDIKNSDFPFQI